MDAGRIGPLWADVKKRLRDPLQLRFALVLSSLAVWYMAACRPMSAGIDAAAAAQGKSEAHLSVVREIEALRAQAAKFRDRVPPRSDANEWVEYMLGGIRAVPTLTLLKLEPMPMKAHGPFNLIVLRIELQGGFADLDAFLGWIEANPRLCRVDSLNFKPGPAKAGGLVLQLTVLGVMG